MESDNLEAVKAGLMAPGLKEKTQVNKKEFFVTETAAGPFYAVVPPGYLGEVCMVCHMPAKEACKNGIAGLHAETRKLDLDHAGSKSSYVVCPQKREWERDWKPLVPTSESKISDIETEEVESSA